MGVQMTNYRTRSKYKIICHQVVRGLQMRKLKVRMITSLPFYLVVKVSRVEQNSMYNAWLA